MGAPGGLEKPEPGSKRAGNTAHYTVTSAVAALVLPPVRAVTPSTAGAQ